MTNLRPFVTALIVGAAVSVTTYAATAPTDSTQAATSATTYRHGHRHGLMGQVLRNVGLGEDQKTQIHSIYAQVQPQFQALRAESKASRESLATVAPTDPSYPALVAAAQSNAAAHVQLRANTWSQIYAVLTPAQQAQIPALVAAAKAERQTRQAARQARHGSA